MNTVIVSGLSREKTDVQWSNTCKIVRFDQGLHFASARSLLGQDQI